MADGVDARIEPMQPAAMHPPVDRRAAEADLEQFPTCDHALPPRCELGDRPLT
jgi:hypothetical protein